MATLVLTTVGSMFGPIGGALGAVIGKTIDSRLFAPDTREGPRLKELAVTSSSYGTPLARIYGRMRVPGTVIWSTDLLEHSHSEGGGKGRPSATSYSYSVSFAVALSSRPIDGLGRIWADGNLLRGAGGDLKTGGTLRIHTGHADQAADPLMAAALGAQCPAHRGCSYVVFEDLDLSDFGNRIPTLSFEILAGDGAHMIGAMLGENGLAQAGAARIPALSGFSHEGGSLRQVAQLADRLHPLMPLADGASIGIGHAESANRPALPLPPPLPPACAWDDGDFGKTGGLARHRHDAQGQVISALRYYDPARDYQPGMQHIGGGSAEGAVFEFPGVLSAGDARDLARQANRRTAMQSETLAWRCATLDPDLRPGALVTAPGHAGIWQIHAWEWREGGIELELTRHRATAPAVLPTDSERVDPGRGWTPPDRLAGQTLLRIFELPWDGTGSANHQKAYAAIGATSGRWSGATLFAMRGDALEPTGLAARRPAIMGTLAAPLPESTATRLQPQAACLVSLASPGAGFTSVDLAQLAAGANRLLIGSEIVQFAHADPLGHGQWRLTGLLRGRGGTEWATCQGHEIGTAVTLLDEKLVEVPAQWLSRPDNGFAAIGADDAEPVPAALELPFESLRPPSPVHARRQFAATDDLLLGWTRRARGGWRWLGGVDQPLVEESESYEVALGPLDAPYARWIVSEPQLTIPATQIASLGQSYPGAALWVQQIGSFARSRPLSLGVLA